MSPGFALRGGWWRKAVAASVLVAGAVVVVAPAADNVPDAPPVTNRVYEAELPEIAPRAYAEAVERLLAAHEDAAGRKFTPGARGRAALKVYSDSGAGLATPPDLVRGVIAALQRRGFAPSSLMIVGLNAPRLRAAGFLPPLSVGGGDFEGVPVLALDGGEFYDPVWFYDSAVPSTRIDGTSGEWSEADRPEAVTEADRRSLLPVPLMFDVDFWINLPACTDHPVLGVNGALVNASLWNASNTQRFFRSPANGPAAAAEIGAIPELRATWACTIVSLERYQFIGGPVFNSLYTVSEPRVWLSENPVMIDALLQDRINQGRIATGFRPLRADLRLLAYGQQVGLGLGDRTLVEWVPVAVPGS